MRQNDVIGIIDFSGDVVVKYYYNAYVRVSVIRFDKLLSCNYVR